MKGLGKLLEKIEGKLKEWRGRRGRDAQKKRWQLRREWRGLKGYKIRHNKATKKGESKGAFGHCHAVLDPRRAMSPKEMREREKERKEKGNVSYPKKVQA